VLLLQGAMPTAQNLVVLLNLDEKVQPHRLCNIEADGGQL
jgi:hypothetical protein